MLSQDLRRDERSPTQIAAQIMVAPNLPKLLCTIIDVSARGAGLWVGTTFGIPDRFDLIINGEQRPRKCKVAWKSDHRLGISYC